MRYAIYLISTLLLTSIASASEFSDAEIRQKVQWLVETNQFPSQTDSLQTLQFYKQRKFKPAWVTGATWSRQAWQLIEIIRQAESHGLNPDDYKISAIIKDLDSVTNSPQSAATLDIRLTNSYYTYARHMLRGRVTAANMPRNWEVDLRNRDLGNLLETALTKENVEQSLQTLVPPHEDYELLRIALKRYRDIRDNGIFVKVPSGDLLRRGDIDPRVALLRQRLTNSHDLVSKTNDESKLFDEFLERSLRRFQHRHGLEVDGILGPKTLQALNVPLKKRIEQIELNLERLRWLPADLGDRHIRVNIAAYELNVIEKNISALSMRVIVGERFHQTPIFSRDMTYIAFSPYWNIPNSIAVNEMLPKIQNNPNYLEQENIAVFAGWNENQQKINPFEVDWSNYSTEVFPFHLRQQPGPANALGLVKFMLPNPYAIYLHDTPARQLFTRPVRGFSHGCIRLEQPFVLAKYLLRDLPEWDEDRRTQVASSGVETLVHLREPIPVHLMYLTAWADSSGMTYFRDDVYERDVELARILNYQ